MATPATTVTMLPMTERLKTLLSHTLSTAHTKGMISSFAICSSTPMLSLRSVSADAAGLGMPQQVLMPQHHTAQHCLVHASAEHDRRSLKGQQLRYLQRHSTALLSPYLTSCVACISGA